MVFIVILVVLGTPKKVQTGLSKTCFVFKQQKDMFGFTFLVFFPGLEVAATGACALSAASWPFMGAGDGLGRRGWMLWKFFFFWGGS